jgi:hypothetical protein
VDLLQLAALVDFSPGNFPGRGNKLFPAQGADGCGRGKLHEETDEPIISAGVPEALDLREMQRQVMCNDPVAQLGAGAGYLLVGLGDLLEIVRALDQRVVVLLRYPLLEQLENHLRILGVILVPAVEHRVAIASAGNRRHLADVEALLQESIR